MSSNAATTAGLIEALAGHVRELSAKIGERSVLRGDGLDRAKAYVRGAFEAAGLTVTEQAYGYDGRLVVNLIAAPPGLTADATPYIIGAHYDSVIGTPGADDNASAVAVMLELARRTTAKPPVITQSWNTAKGRGQGSVGQANGHRNASPCRPRSMIGG